MKILVTGSAGFIGNELCLALLNRGEQVIGIDNINDYYSVKLKHDRLGRLGINDYEPGKRHNSILFPNFQFIKMDLADKEQIDKLFDEEHFDYVVNLAAQAGVRYSITHPYTYLESNVLGFLNILEACRNHPIKHLVYASSSSVYGLNTEVPYTEDQNVDKPVSLYAAFKKTNELMAHAYAKLYNIPSTGLRFFTVYGPWGRPDMSPMLFADAITKGTTLKVFNNGNMLRDFTYITDIIDGILAVIEHAPNAQSTTAGVCTKVYNIGCGHSVQLMDFIHELESQFGKEANKEFLPMQQGDVYQTYADTKAIEHDFSFKPSTQLHEGLKHFVEWYKSYDF